MIAILSDIHGNLEALTSVLGEIQKDDLKTVILLGDLVDYGADSAEVLEEIFRMKNIVDVVSIRGNHDEAVLENDCSRFKTSHGRQNFEITLKDLDRPGLLDKLNSLCKTSAAIGYNTFFCHATPDDRLWGKSPEVSPIVDYSGLKICRSKDDKVIIGGHSHIQGFGQFETGEIYINPGSVGQPRNGDPRAQFVVCNDDLTEFEFRRVEYDTQTAASKIKKSGRPDFLYIRVLLGI